jgi:hypothetical protein
VGSSWKRHATSDTAFLSRRRTRINHPTVVRIGNGRGEAEITTGRTSEMIVGLDECDDIRLTIADEWSNLG